MMLKRTSINLRDPVHPLYVRLLADFKEFNFLLYYIFKIKYLFSNIFCSFILTFFNRQTKSLMAYITTYEYLTAATYLVVIFFHQNILLR